MAKFFFVTYCFGDSKGQTLIGVYKRGLRIAIELSNRGHQVVFFCTGRQGYSDGLTRYAETCLNFVDIPFTVASFEEARHNRQTFLDEIKQISPDVIVIGEAPLAGALLEAALCGVELGIPVVIIDNAYNPLFVEVFCQVHGPLADGILLTGPSSHYLPNPPPYLCQVPPFIESFPQAAKELLQIDLGLSAEKLVTILAYDGKVEKLGLSFLTQLDIPDVDFLFCSKNPEALQEVFDQLPEGTRRRARVIDQPLEPILFGLLELSRLAIVKYGFMQVSECLSLRTPVIVVFHEGPAWLDSLPEVSKQFTWVTTNAETDDETLTVAKRFLNMDPTAMDSLHTGEFGAAVKAADFLERFPSKQRLGTEEECAKLGFSRDVVHKALQHWLPESELSIDTIRASRLRLAPDYQLYSIICGYSTNGNAQFARLWGRIYASPQAASTDLQILSQPDSRRMPLYYSEAGCILIEDDNGEAELPPLNP